MFRIFSFDHFRLSEGVLVQEHTLTNGQKIPAILIGEAGRGRKLGVIPVKGSPVAIPGERIFAARPQKAGDGANLTWGDPATADQSACLVAIRCDGGFRGCLFIDGERLSPMDGDHPQYNPLPAGCVLARGNTADGDAGRMGSSEQILALIREGEVVSIRPTGRRHAGTHFLRWLAGSLHVASLEERTQGLADEAVWPALPASPATAA